MAVPAERISKSQVTKAGETMRHWIETIEPVGLTVEVNAALEAIDGWRQSHAYPLSLVTPGVRNWVSQETSGPVVVGQRLKRFNRILEKLVRMPSLRLPQMEDIAGCRAVLQNPSEVEAVRGRIRRKWEVVAESDYRDAGKPVRDTAAST